VYVPIDISESSLRTAAQGLAREFPRLRVAPLVGDFSRPHDIPVRRGRPSVVYFPGSTIGNLTPEEAHAFLSMTRGVAGKMLIGVDLKKDPAVLHAAYNDAAGVTAAFNLNLLARINRELGADFDVRRFRHYAFYNPALGRVEMHLVALENHNVRLGRHRFRFAAGETIHTENSYKYSLEGFRALAASAGFARAKNWTDRRGLFAVCGLS
jgi:dimethylhistidine N-methyltransferase